MLLLILFGVRGSDGRWSVRLGSFGLLFLKRFFAVLLSWILLFLFWGGRSPVDTLRAWMSNEHSHERTCTWRFRKIYKSSLVSGLLPSRNALLSWCFTGSRFILSFLFRILLERVTFYLKHKHHKIICLLVLCILDSRSLQTRYKRCFSLLFIL